MTHSHRQMTSRRVGAVYPVAKPSCLRQGDTVRTSPRLPLSRQKFMAGVTILRELGLKPVWRDDIFSSCDYLAGDDARRASEMVQAFRDPDSAAVFLPGAGSGVPGRASRSETKSNCRQNCWSGFRTSPRFMHFLVARVLSPFMARTSRRCLRWNRTRLSSIAETSSAWIVEGIRHVTGFAPLPRAGPRAACLRRISPFSFPWPGRRLCLTFEGRILVLEDLNEPYRLDRMLFQLSLQPGFGQVAAVVFGDFMLEGDDIPCLKGRWQDLRAGGASPW